MLLLSISVSFADSEAGESEEEFKVIDHSKVWEEKGITKYEGSKTCIQCHEDKVRQVFHSYHYQLFSENEVSTGKP